MSGDIQPRKRKGKGKKKDEAEDDMTDTKGKAMTNNIGKNHSTTNGDSSGIIAKIIFLVLLVSLSLVVALILIELQGKQAGIKETVSVVHETKEEDLAAPEIPTPNIHMDMEVIPEAPSPILQQDIEEEYEPIEATPPLEEYIHVEEVIVEAPPQRQKRVVEKVEPEVSTTDDKLDEVNDASAAAEEEEFVEAIPVEESIEVPETLASFKEATPKETAPKDMEHDVVTEEVIPVEEHVEAVTVEESLQVKNEADDVPIEETLLAEEVKKSLPLEGPPVVKEMKSALEEEKKEEPSEETGELALPENNEVEDLLHVEHVSEMGAPAGEIEEVTLASEKAEEELPGAEEDGALDAFVNIQVKEVLPVDSETPIENQNVDDHKEEAEGQPKKGDNDYYDDDDDDEDDDDDDDDDEIEKIVGKRLGQDVTEEEEEDWSQYGKEGEVGLLTDAYLKVESLAEQVLAKDPNNAMVAQLAPHLSGVLQAMEGGQTNGLLDTLKHIQVILEDVKNRIEAEEPSEQNLGSPVNPSESEVVPEDVFADIESQIIPDEALHEEHTYVFPPSEEDEAVLPSPADGKDPVPVDEVIPDPIHIEPLQEPSEPLKEVLEDIQPPVYEKADITSETDKNLREDLDAAEKLIPQNPGKALNSFGAILQNTPKSARAIYGRARSLDRLAEMERSNSRLEQAIVTYRGVLDLADEDPTLVPLPLLRMAAETCVDRLIFRGFFGKAVRIQQRLLQRFPDDLKLRNKMGVTFLLMNQGSAAKEIFEAVLQKWPDDGFAQVHYGFILKTTYNNNTGGAFYMQKGIESEAEGTSDGRFYFHLGDALQREGKTIEAYQIYDRAVEKGLFFSRYQRSLYNVDRLSSQPFWTLEQTTYQVSFRKLEENWKAIRDEGVALLALPPQDGFRPESENLREIGDWKQFELFSRGRKITANCIKAPITCLLIENFPAAAGCKRGQVKFSVMHPHTHVYAHTGPTNCRLRAHLGLVVPDGLRLRVGTEVTSWQEGKIFIFDDSWEHEVWHEGDSYRLVLIVDVWHPELTEEERNTLVPI